MELTEAQQIFAVFYAIFFGIMLQTVGMRRSNPVNKDKEENHDITLNLFDTPNAWAIGLRYDNKPFWRFIFSLIFLNIIPGIIFAVIFSGLGMLSQDLQWFEILAIIWISLAPHYIYRIYLAFVVLFISELYLDHGEYDDYNPSDILARELLIKDRKQYLAHSSFLNHFGFPFFIILPSYVLFYDFVFKLNQIGSIWIYAAWTLLVLGIVLFIAPRKLK